MELLYIWIDSYKNIRRQGFNFSPKYRFDFVPTKNEKDEVTGGDLTCTENDFPDNFFGEGISNVTAIVGENGSGKSTLLGFALMNICGMNSFYTNSAKHFFIVKIDNEIQIGISPEFSIITPPIIKKILLKTSSFYERGTYNYSETIHDYDVAFLLYSDITNYKTVDITPRCTNLSSWNILKKSKNDAESYDTDEMLKQIFFVNTSHLQDYIPFQLPTAIELAIDFRAESNREAISEDKWGKYLSLHYYLEDKLKSKQLEYWDIIILNLIQCLHECEYDDFYKDYINPFLLSLENTTFKNDFLNFVDIHKETSLICKLMNYLLSIFENNIIKKIEYRLLSHGNESDNLFSEHRIYAKIKINEPYCQDLLNTYKEIFTLTRNPFIKLNWGQLSSGEISFLTIFSRFYKILYHNTDLAYAINDKKHLIIFIDEGELGLHPQWQKAYLKSLIDVLPQIFKDKKIQIILTSHSPFLVSDLPKENIIFLEKGEKGECVIKNSLHEMKQTFGANIHTLLTDSFFMQDKGLMGKFAEGKINDVIDWLNNGSNENITKLAKEQNGNATQTEKELKLVQWLIKQIGEPIIRNQLQKMLDSRRLEKVETHEEQIRKLESSMRFLQKQIEQLKSKKE